MAAMISALLVVIVWWPLVNGGGLVGGDIYPYFFPQKQVVAESFANGTTPLWHHRTGLGYPLHAESQAGIFYPTTQVFYRTFDVHTAYHVNLLIHYGLALLFSWRLIRCYGIGTWPALLGAMVFVYGWFPARVSLEWSIVGGVFLPLTLWQTEEFVRRPSIRRMVLLGICFGIHLLAGHFALAFICQLTCLLYAVGRTWQLRASQKSSAGGPVVQGASSDGAVKAIVKNSSAVVGAIGLSMILASVQLLPTLELKRLSQREPAGVTSKVFDPAYGHMPPGYVTQVAYSWFGWHSADSVRNGHIFQAFGSVTADTNKVEAHLYWGLIPLGLMLLITVAKVRRGFGSDIWQLWLVLMLLATVYATGWLMPVAKYLPGFGFFMGPGRYLIVTSLGGSILTAMVVQTLLQRRSSVIQAISVIVVAAITLPDMLMSSEYIADAIPVQSPPLYAAEGSWMKSAFDRKSDGGFEVRVLAPGPNIINLFGAGGIPVYLGIGPAIYYTEATRPDPVQYSSAEALPDSVANLAITHVLTTQPLPDSDGHLDQPISYPDGLLGRIWGTSDAPYLYSVKEPRGRVTSNPVEALRDSKLLNRGGDFVEFEVNCSGPAQIRLAELMYPGWTVSVDGEPLDVAGEDSTFRTVDAPEGRSVIRWTYAPTSYWIGKWVSLIGLLIVTIMFVIGSKKKDVTQ